MNSPHKSCQSFVLQPSGGKHNSLCWRVIRVEYTCNNYDWLRLLKTKPVEHTENSSTFSSQRVVVSRSSHDKRTPVSRNINRNLSLYLSLSIYIYIYIVRFSLPLSLSIYIYRERERGDMSQQRLRQGITCILKKNTTRSASAVTAVVAQTRPIVGECIKSDGDLERERSLSLSLYVYIYIYV